jgi:hypothetical protein
VVLVQEVFESAFAALVSPVQNIFPLCLASWAVGRQSCRVACLLVSVSEHDCPLKRFLFNLYDRFIFRFSDKVTQLLEGGLIRNYVNKENDKVAKLASGSSRLNFKKYFSSLSYSDNLS